MPLDHHHMMVALTKRGRAKLLTTAVEPVLIATCLATSFFLYGNHPPAGRILLTAAAGLGLWTVISTRLEEWKQWKGFADFMRKQIAKAAETCDCGKCVAWRDANGMPHPEAAKRDDDELMFIVGNKQDIGSNPRYWN